MPIPIALDSSRCGGTIWGYEKSPVSLFLWKSFTCSGKTRGLPLSRHLSFMPFIVNCLQLLRMYVKMVVFRENSPSETGMTAVVDWAVKINRRCSEKTRE